MVQLFVAVPVMVTRVVVELRAGEAQFLAVECGAFGVSGRVKYI